MKITEISIKISANPYSHHFYDQALEEKEKARKCYKLLVIQGEIKEDFDRKYVLKGKIKIHRK